MSETIFTFKKLHQAYLDCRENKRGTASALVFEWDLERKLFKLQEELQSKKYNPGCAICFVVTEPSPREIFAAGFRDRIVHHILVNELELIGERVFIYDSYSCRERKGTHKAVERLRYFIRKITSNNSREAYYLQLDISGFFMNINQNILYAILKKLILKQQKSYQWKKDILWLSKKLIFHKPTDNYIIKGNPDLFELIPPRKSLFKSPENRGLPIGNYSSQFFANLYLNQLDQFVKRELKENYYLRYVDDFLILGSKKEELESLISKINTFLKGNLDLELNFSKTKLKNINEGIDFLGYIIKPHYVLVRKRVVNTLKRKLYSVNSANALHNLSPPENILAMINSYYGHFKHADSFRLRKDVYENHLGEIKSIFKPRADYSALELKQQVRKIEKWIKWIKWGQLYF